MYGKPYGFKYLKNYTPEEYNHHPQNWQIAQDRRGVIYVGNQAGLLEFDGVSWRVIMIPNWSVRSLAIDEGGVIFIGGKDEFGFLTPDAPGTWKYVSLVPQLGEYKKEFSSVWSTHATPEGVYFRTSKYLFRWFSGKIKVWEAYRSFKASFYCRGRFWVQQEDVGLLEMKNDSLRLVPGGETFAGEKIYMLAPYNPDELPAPGKAAAKKLLIGTRSLGFYMYDGYKAVPFPTDADAYLRKNQPYHGIRLSSGDYALATLQGGVVIMDPGGKPRQVYTTSSDLQDDDVKYVYQDKEGNVWLALNKGISRIEETSPFSLYDRRSDLKGIVLAVVRHDGYLYAGTTNGIFFLDKDSTFRMLPGMFGMCWDLLSMDNALLAATDNGIFRFVFRFGDGVVSQRSESPRRIFTERSFVMERSHSMPDRVWVATPGGLASLVKPRLEESNASTWTVEYPVDHPGLSIRTIVEDQKGSLWLGTLTDGVLKVEFPAKDDTSHPVVIPYNTGHGLPPKEINVFWAAGHVMFAAENGIYRFHEKETVFVPDPTLGKEFAEGSRNIFRLVEDGNKHIWIHSRGKNIEAVPEPGESGGVYDLRTVPFLRMPVAQVNVIYPDPGGAITWFGSVDGLIAYDNSDNSMVRKYRQEFPALIRRVVVNSTFLSYDGFRSQEDVRGREQFPVIDFKDRNLRFHFAAPFFEDETATRFCFRLDGYDSEWSSWTPESQKDYTNLDAGFYRFRVLAKNVYDYESSEAVFPFRILPPWYKTWWAFSLYGLLVFLSIYMITRWRSRHLYEEKLRLEKLVHDRTRDIEAKNRQLELQSAQLKEIVEVKSHFFTNISHEFRTPLTLIMGPLEEIRSRFHDTELEKNVDLMMRNSQRLLGLINQLLDLSKSESGKLILKALRQDLIPFLKSILSSFKLMAEKRRLELVFSTDIGEVFLYYDPEKMEKVLYNLLSNAIKFTPSPGTVAVAVSIDSTSSEKFPLGSVDIDVSDSGIGIPESQLAFIFDRFYQVDSARMRDRGRIGAGIGLALAKELVELHHGRLDVRSRVGENGASGGTTFNIRLPLGADHLAPDEKGEESDFLSLDPREPGDFQVNDGIMMDGAEDSGRDSGDAEVRPGHDTILVVEDNGDLRTYIKGSLDSGYNVIEAGGGREGIEKAVEMIPDLIISDIMMPDTDGFELCRVLKNTMSTSHIPIILLTARTSEESVIRGLETGADDYITKPFNPRILNARIKNLLDLRRQLQLKRKRQMTLEPDDITVSSMDDTFIKELHDLIENNLENPEFNVDQLVKKIYMGRTTLYKKILALTGESPSRFIRSYRLKRAAQLLDARAGNVTEVAFRVGFTSTSYFSKCFKEQFHRLPSDY